MNINRKQRQQERTIKAQAKRARREQRRREKRKGEVNHESLQTRVR